MPSQQEVKWSQLKVGLVVLVSLLLLVILLFLLTSASGISVFRKNLTAVVYLQNAEGLKVGAPVDLHGVPVGEVKAVLITNDPARARMPVEIVLRLNSKFQPDLHSDTHATLSTTGVLGDAVMELSNRGSHGPTLQEGQELPTMESASINSVMETSQTTLEQLNVTLGKLNTVVDGLQQGKGTVGQLFQNPALYNEANATVAQLHTLAADLNSNRGSAGKLLHDDALYNHLNEAAARLDTLATNLSAGKGSAGKLLTDDALYNNLNSTLTRTNALLADVDQGKGTVGLLFKDQATANKLNDTVTQLDTMLAGINQGKGTVGQLVTNDTAYNNLNHLLTESSALVTMIRQDPKKYLVIRLKIF